MTDALTMSSPLSTPTYIEEEEFDLYKLGLLVTCVVFAGVSLMVIAAMIGLFIKVQNLQKRIDLILSPSKSLRANEDLSKRYTMISEKNAKINNSGPSLRYQSSPETSGYQGPDFSEKGTPSSMRHNDRMNDLYY